MLDHLAEAGATPQLARAASPQTPFTVPPFSLPAMLEDTAERFPSHVAIDFLGREWRYAALQDAVARAASGLQRIGVTQGVRVGLCLPNTPYSVIFFFAVLRAGGIVVNYNPLYVERELAHQIGDSGTTIMVTVNLSAIYNKVANIAAQAGLRHIVVCDFAAALPFPKNLLFRIARRKDIAPLQKDGRSLAAATLLRGTSLHDAAPSRQEDVAVLQYTGGTTGIPKAAELTHANLVANVEQSRLAFGDRPCGQDTVIGVLPLFHVFALTSVMLYGVRSGSRLVLLPRFDLEQVLQTVARTRPTILPAVPTIYSALNEAARTRKIDLSSIEFCCSGGAPLPTEVRQNFMDLTGAWLIEGYGLSETSPVASLTPPGTPYRTGSVGKAVAGSTIEIRDPENPAQILAPNTRGEICIRGPQVMRGYWNKPEETANVMVDGALRTGDIGYLDEEGYLFLVDRIKDLIIAGGYNIYPRVLEEALYEHEAVKEAVVIGVPDAHRGQAPKAFVTLKEGTSATPEGLRDFLTTYVSKIELPREVEIRATLPKTLVGKLSKKELVEEERLKEERK